MFAPWRAAIFAAAALVAAAGGAHAQATEPVLPSVQGPIHEPGSALVRGVPYTEPGKAPADFDYVTDEYFIRGRANGSAYRTRLRVHRPPAEAFSGIALMEVMDADGRASIFQSASRSILIRGHAHVEIAALTDALQVPEVVAQVAFLLKGNATASPLAPLPVRRLLFLGASQGSVALRDYQAQKHFQARLPVARPVVDGYLAVSTPGTAPLMALDVPTIHMATTTEAALGIAYRRADGDRYRLFEVAGMAHADSRSTAAYSPNPCALPLSDFPWGAMVAMGLHHLVQWVDHGVVPPRAPPLEFDNDLANDGSRLALDANGNPKGGVRSSYVDVPAAAYGVPNGTGAACTLAGWKIAFDGETLRALYKTPDAYFARVNRRVMDLIREGWLLPEYAEDIRADARTVQFPVQPP